MSDTKAMQRLCGLMRKAVQQYEMLAPGDRVLVGVSGGKDSVALTIGLARLRQYLGFPFEVVAVTLDPQFGGKPVDYSALEELCRRYDVSYEVRRTLIGPIVFDYRKEKNPCSLCAKMRRGALNDTIRELAPASRSCLSAGMSGCMPGVRKTISACTPSKYPSPTWSVAPSRSSSRTSSSSFSRGVLSQARTVSPRASSMRMSGRFETPMPSTAMRLPRKPSKYAETFSFMVSSSFSRLYLHYIRHRKKLQLV